MPVAAPASPDLDSTAESRAGSRLRALQPSVAVAIGGVVLVGVVLRFATRSPLWLDEALSVNIAREPITEIGSRMRQDGHPPLYYWVLHFWTDLFGTSRFAVRALSGVASAATLPFVYAAGKRLGGTYAGAAALVMMALLPFNTRYATEARMYALIMFVVIVGYLAVVRALEVPSLARLALVTVAAGAACWLHYWGIFLVAATFIVLALSRRLGHVDRRAARSVLVALVAGGATLLLWLPSMLYQLEHTGTPWAQAARPSHALAITINDLGGLLIDGHVLGTGLMILIAMALFLAPPWGDDADEVVFEPVTVPGIRGEILVAALALALGVAVATATHGSYESRYAAISVPLVVLCASVGITRLTQPNHKAVSLALVALFCMPGLADNVVTSRSQAAKVIAALDREATTGDAVVYCPDQLGPAFSRGLDKDLDLSVYPTGADPAFVDWRDYEERNAAADPFAFADAVLEAAGERDVWLVWAPGYRTFGQACEAVATRFESERPGSQPVVIDDGTTYYEHAWLIRYRAQR